MGHSPAGEKVGIWHARLDAAERQWERGEAVRETLRKIVSELEFPPLMVKPRGGGEDDGTADYEYSHVEQINLNLLLRVLDKYRAHAGDESPEIRVPRDKGRTLVAEFEDRLLTRVMERGGGPEALYDSVARYFTDGNCVLWAIMPFLPTQQSLQQAAESMDDKIERAAQEGLEVEPKMGEDMDRTARAMRMGVFSHPRDIMVDAVANPDGEQISPMDRVMAAAAKYAVEAEKSRKKGLNWQDYDNQVTIELSPLGPEGTLLDNGSTNPRNVKWIGRRILMRPEEARNHEALARRLW